MNEAIKLAIEKGGWKPEVLGLLITKQLNHPEDYIEKDWAVLQPLFWQALGKALGWKEPKQGRNIVPGFYEPVIAFGLLETWVWYALRYHELVLTGGDTEKFWKELSQA
jgi:hypothetical protein